MSFNEVINEQIYHVICQIVTIIMTIISNKIMVHGQGSPGQQKVVNLI
jgi:hypothetical protein